MSDESHRNVKMTVPVSIPHIMFVIWLIINALHFFSPGDMLAYKFVVIMVGIITACLLAMRWWAAGTRLDAFFTLVVFIFTTFHLIDVTWFPTSGI